MAFKLLVFSRCLNELGGFLSWTLLVSTFACFSSTGTHEGYIPIFLTQFVPRVS